MKRANIDTINSQLTTDFNDGNIALISDVNSIKQRNNDTILIENFLMIVVIKGHATICIDNNETQVHENDIFVCRPSNILEKSMMSMDLEIRGFILSAEAVESIMKDVNIGWSFRTLAMEHKVLHANESEIQRLCLYYDLLNNKLNAPETNNQKHVLKAIIEALVHEMPDIFENNQIELSSSTYSSGNYIFQQFITMLEDTHQPIGTVNDYAEFLNITPKYFSSVCKKQCGKTASEMIREETLKRAKILLRDKGLSIKMIASHLNFANQSHFGTYFHRYTGLSPQQFRQQM